MNTNIIELLEPRIAPALGSFVLSSDGRTAKYFDVDGDHVAVTVTAGLFNGQNPGGSLLLETGPDGSQLQLLDLTDPGFNGANVTFSVVRVPGGDGLANVGYINGGANDFGSIVVKGDLGRIDTGSNTSDTFAIRSLSVRSMGSLGLETQAAGGSLQSNIHDTLGTLKVAGDMEASIDATRIGSVFIGGSLLGGAGFATGSLNSNEDIGPVKIGHDLIGGLGQSSGRITTNGGIASLIIGGSLIGGPGPGTGYVSCSGPMAMLKIGRDLIGGSDLVSGYVQAYAGLAAITIGGSVVGGAGFESGKIRTDRDFGVIKIGGDVIGGAGEGSGSIVAGGKFASMTIRGSLISASIFSGVIIGSDNMGPLKIGRDMIGGSLQSVGVTDGTPIASITIGGSLIGGRIVCEGDLGPVKIGGNVVGGTTNFSGSIIAGSDPFAGKLVSVTIGGSLIGGTGNATGFIGASGAIGSVKIGRDMIGQTILGNASVNKSARIESMFDRIGSVTIGGSIVAGGDYSDGSITGSATIRAAHDIGSLTVKGSLIGNPGNGMAENVSRVMISARGQEFPRPGVDVAIGRVSIGGRVELANILAGYNIDGTPGNGDAQIGAVSVGGDWIASNLVAGVRNDASINMTFGDGGDASIVGGSPGIFSRIASITIKGAVLGQPGGGAFGFGAQEIGSFKYNGISLVLTRGSGNDNFLGAGNAGAARPIGPSLSATLNDGFAVHVFEV